MKELDYEVGTDGLSERWESFCGKSPQFCRLKRGISQTLPSRLGIALLASPPQKHIVTSMAHVVHVSFMDLCWCIWKTISVFYLISTLLVAYSWGRDLVLFANATLSRYCTKTSREFDQLETHSLEKHDVNCTPCPWHAVWQISKLLYHKKPAAVWWRPAHPVCTPNVQVYSLHPWAYFEVYCCF